MNITSPTPHTRVKRGFFMYIGLGILLIMSVVTVLGFSRYVLRSLGMPKLVALILILITAVLRAIPESELSDITIGYAGIFTAFIALALWLFVGDARMKAVEFFGICALALGIITYYRVSSAAFEWEYLIYPIIVAVFAFVFGMTPKSAVVVAALGVITGELLKRFVVSGGNIMLGGGYTFEYMITGMFFAVLLRRIVERIASKRRVASSYEAAEIDPRDDSEAE